MVLQDLVCGALVMSGYFFARQRPRSGSPEGRAIPDQSGTSPPRHLTIELDQVYSSLVNRVAFHGWGGRYGTNTLSAYRGERLVQTVEDMLASDDVGQAVPVEIGQQGRLGMDQHQHDSLASQVVLEGSQYACRRVIDVRDRAGVYHQPAHRRGRLFDETAHVFRKTASVGVEEGRSELEDYQAGPAQRTVDGRCRPPLPGAGLHQHCRVRTIAVAYMAEQ